MPALARRQHNTVKLEEFQATNLYAEKTGQLYVVYSFRDDWPIYIHHPSKGWFVNSDPPYSLTTARHMVNARPAGAVLKPMSLENMLGFIQQNTRQPA